MHCVRPAMVQHQAALLLGVACLWLPRCTQPMEMSALAINKPVCFSVTQASSARRSHSSLTSLDFSGALGFHGRACMCVRARKDFSWRRGQRT